MQKTPAKLWSLSAFPSVCALAWLFRSQRPIRGHHFCLRTSKSPLSCNSRILQKCQKISIIFIDTFWIFVFSVWHIYFKSTVPQFKTASQDHHCVVVFIWNSVIPRVLSPHSSRWTPPGNFRKTRDCQKFHCNEKSISMGNHHIPVSHVWSGYIQLQQLFPLVTCLIHSAAAVPQ